MHGVLTAVAIGSWNPVLFQVFTLKWQNEAYSKAQKHLTFDCAFKHPLSIPQCNAHSIYSGKVMRSRSFLQERPESNTHTQNRSMKNNLLQTITHTLIKTGDHLVMESHRLRGKSSFTIFYSFVMILDFTLYLKKYQYWKRCTALFPVRIKYLVCKLQTQHKDFISTKDRVQRTLHWWCPLSDQLILKCDPLHACTGEDFTVRNLILTSSQACRDMSAR